MRWRTLTEDEKFNQRVERMCRWHRWFAWYPITVNSTEVGKTSTHWLEYVGRKKIITMTHSEFGRSTYIGDPSYCVLEDLVYNALTDNEIVDLRDRYDY